MKIQNVLVLGAGSAGLIAALSLKRRIPELNVTIVRSPEIGVIGVGEGTTPNFPAYIFQDLGISLRDFHEVAEPTWKLGIKFLWGTRGRFDFSFSPQLDVQWADFPLPHGFYSEEEFSYNCVADGLIREDKAFGRLQNGMPDMQPWFAFHIENAKFVAVLEKYCVQAGVVFLDGKMTTAERCDAGIRSITLEDGRKLEADFFVDASGFRSELIGKAMEVPYKDFRKTLFCDRAVVGGWERTDETILPYTTAEEMDAGWCWQIDHEHHINRGYVFSSDHITDDQAAEEYTRKNPKAPSQPRVVKFRSGYHEQQWVGNVFGIGNSTGFVEPLEATALMIVCKQCKAMVDFLKHSSLEPTPSIRALFNDTTRDTWEEIRDFLGLHYAMNQAPQTEYWKRCREETDLSGIAELLEFYRENGPTGFCRYRMPNSQSDFGIEGYLTILIGNQVPHQKRHTPSEQELKLWNARRDQHRNIGRNGLTVKEALACIRDPRWKWNGEA